MFLTMDEWAAHIAESVTPGPTTEYVSACRNADALLYKTKIQEAVLDGTLPYWSRCLDSIYEPASFKIAFLQDGKIHIEDLKKWLGLRSDLVRSDVTVLHGSSIEVKQAEARTTSAEEQPWTIIDQRDPAPEQTWYTPARYFARELIKDDVTLLKKRDLLAKKVKEMMDSAGYKKRGGKEALEASTIKKAFTNIKLA